jgi:hypothetical protein
MSNAGALGDKMKPIIIIVITVAVALAVIFLIPFIDEFETFNCITTPCEMPKITIVEKIEQSFIEN